MANLTKEGDDDATDLFDEGGDDGFERELVLDRSIAQKDAVAALVEATDEAAFTETCLTLVSCLTCHNITDVMKESDRFISAANSFQEVMMNWPSKDDDTRVTLLSSCLRGMESTTHQGEKRKRRKRRKRKGWEG